MAAAGQPPERRSIDYDRVALWTRQIAAGIDDDIVPAFAAHGARGPEFRWRPTPDQAGTPPLRFLCAHWNDLAAVAAQGVGAPAAVLPRASQVDAVAMRPALGFIMLVDVLPGGEDFRYRLYGSQIAAVTGFDMTGTRVSQHRAPTFVVEYFLAAYRAVLARREPLYSAYSPGSWARTAVWQRLVLPLTDESGEVIRFLAGTVPVARNQEVLWKRF